MVKFVANFLFVLIIFVLATAIPLSMDIFSLDLSPVIIDEPTDDGTALPAHYTFTGNNSPYGSLSFTVKSDKGTVDSGYLEPLQIRLTDAAGAETVVDFPETVTTTATEEGGQLVTVDLDTFTNILETGYYTATLVTSESAYDIDASNPPMGYLDAFKETYSYAIAPPAPADGKERVRFYYPDPTYSHLVPITRDVATGGNYWRYVYNTLVNAPPTFLGTYEGETVLPPSPNIRLGGKTAYIDWYSADLVDMTGKIRLAQEAVAYTFLSNGSLTGVQFLLDNSTSSSYDGIDWSVPYTTLPSPAVYRVTTGPDSSLYLLPQAAEVTATGEPAIEALWKTLLTPPADATGFIAVAPPDLALKSQTLLEDGTLYLDFNSAFNRYYTTGGSRYTAFVDALILTMRSVEGVDRIRVKVDGDLPEDPALAEVRGDLPALNYTVPEA
ncbi:GerMN domain-containing protein [Fusibacter sp. JL298sf-3]